jgi:hypothetical protein
LLDDVLRDVVVGGQPRREVMGRVEIEAALEGAQRIDPPGAFEAFPLGDEIAKSRARLVDVARVEHRPDAILELGIKRCSLSTS